MSYMSWVELPLSRTQAVQLLNHELLGLGPVDWPDAISPSLSIGPRVPFSHDFFSPYDVLSASMRELLLNQKIPLDLEVVSSWGADTVAMIEELINYGDFCPSRAAGEISDRAIYELDCWKFFEPDVWRSISIAIGDTTWKVWGRIKNILLGICESTDCPMRPRLQSNFLEGDSGTFASLIEVREDVMGVTRAAMVPIDTILKCSDSDDRYPAQVHGAGETGVEHVEPSTARLNVGDDNVGDDGATSPQW